MPLGIALLHVQLVNSQDVQAQNSMSICSTSSTLNADMYKLYNGHSCTTWQTAEVPHPVWQLHQISAQPCMGAVLNPTGHAVLMVYSEGWMLKVRLLFQQQHW